MTITATNAMNNSGQSMQAEGAALLKDATGVAQATDAEAIAAGYPSAAAKMAMDVGMEQIHNPPGDGAIEVNLADPNTKSVIQAEAQKTDDEATFVRNVSAQLAKPGSSPADVKAFMSSDAAKPIVEKLGNAFQIVKAEQAVVRAEDKALMDSMAINTQ